VGNIPQNTANAPPAAEQVLCDSSGRGRAACDGGYYEGGTKVRAAVLYQYIRYGEEYEI